MAAQEGVLFLMTDILTLSDLSLKKSWVTIGAFDGVHRGHQTLLREFASQARQKDVPAVVVTFFPHPSVFLNSIATPYYLSTLDERSELLKTTGIDHVFTLKFDEHLANLNANEFIDQLLIRLGMESLWIGDDFTFGKGKQGTIQQLEKLAIDKGFALQVRESIKFNDEVISSSRIRSLLSKGNVENASQWLGRLYRIDGVIVHGEGRGKNLGIPTANIQVWKEKLLPADGIYATWIWWERRRFPCVTNVGVRPTFHNDTKRTIEPFILEFNQDLYGKHVTLEFIKYLRAELKFDSADALMMQIEDDIQKAREVFKNAPKTPGLPA